MYTHALIVTGPAAWRLWFLVGSLLALLAAQSCERYTPLYQTLPALDWLEAHPPLDRAARIPSSERLTAGLLVSAPELRQVGGVTSHIPLFTPPELFQRTISGVRDGSLLNFASEDGTEALRARVAVFHREERAQAWLDLMSAEQDMGHPTDFGTGLRIFPPGPEGLWVVPPHPESPPAGGAAYIGRAGVVAFELILVRHAGDAAGLSDQVSLAAQAESDALRIGRAYRSWLTGPTADPAPS